MCCRRRRPLLLLLLPVWCPPQVWLGIGDALNTAVAAGQMPLLQKMYDEWPFFRGMLDLVEMVMAKVGGVGGVFWGGFGEGC